MSHDSLLPPEPDNLLQRWRKAGVDFDCGTKSTLSQLLEIGGFFPLAKVRDRLPVSRNCLYQLSRGHGDDELTQCVRAIRVKEKGRAITILVDLVRLNELITAQMLGEASRRSGETQPQGARPLFDQETP